MKLYHFCATQFLEGIQREGLTLGVTPALSEGGIRLIPHTQWLTVNGSFEQPWNGMVNVKYDRTAFRIEVKVPKDHRHLLLTWPELKARIGRDRVLPGFDNPEFSQSEDWRIFVGRIPPAWLRGVAEKPAPAQLREQPVEAEKGANSGTALIRFNPRQGHTAWYFSPVTHPCARIKRRWLLAHQRLASASLPKVGRDSAGALC